MQIFNKNIKILATLAFIGYLSITLVGMFNIARMTHHELPMHGCPFVIGEHTLCKMGVFEHINLWKVFSTAVPSVSGILLLVSIIFAISFFIYHSPPIIRLFLYCKFTYRKTITLYQQLFASGVLNPKAP